MVILDNTMATDSVHVIDAGVLPSMELNEKQHVSYNSGQVCPLQPLSGPLVWSGADFSQDEPYILQLEQQELDDIKHALDKFKLLGLDGDEVSKQNFPLAALAEKLEGCARTIHDGQGFVIIRGLNSLSLTVEDSVVVYLGIANYIGDQRGLQDRKGNVLSHVTNSKKWTTPVHQRHGIHSSVALPFHNDMGCDILALQARHSAHRGGYTYLSSAWKVYNDLLAVEPEVVATLLTPDWPVQVSGRKARHYFAPVLSLNDNKLMAAMDPGRFGPHPRAAGAATNIPSLTFQQEYALRRVADVAAQHELPVRLETGDLAFVNNWALFHRRDAYADDNDAGSSSRHLVRLWLRSARLGWCVPEEMRPPWLAAFGERQTRKITARLYPLVPMPTYHVPKYSAGSAAFVVESDDDEDIDESQDEGDVGGVEEDKMQNKSLGKQPMLKME